MSKRAVLLVVLLYAAMALARPGHNPQSPRCGSVYSYKANNAPVQSLFVETYCQRKLGWSERRKDGPRTREKPTPHLDSIQRKMAG